ncbi:uncharacterized protein LOC126770243 isoform X3 [Nymphalis io]|uniref:uncharacterized protein LOC126770243 isoform X3 n=1 Tax=Inachis io TaxID=171585 RepID=UPI0021694FB9|nr:uncharacterized protein LOC126770243 isoform X3 [Nymphalis io]
MSAIRGPPSSPTLMQESCAELRSELNFAASEIDHEAGESSSKLIVQRATGVRCGASCGACPSVASLPFGGGRRPRARGRGRVSGHPLHSIVRKLMRIPDGNCENRQSFVDEYRAAQEYFISSLAQGCHLEIFSKLTESTLFFKRGVSLF